MIQLRYFKNQPFSLKANAVAGYKFKHWEIGGNTSGATTLIANNSNWKYFDGNDMPASNWSSGAYNDEGWKNGNAPLGYNSSNSGITTTISQDVNLDSLNTAAVIQTYFVLHLVGVTFAALANRLFTRIGKFDR